MIRSFSMQKDKNMAKKGTIRTTLKLDGADEFNKGIKQADSNLRELRSEMKMNSEQFKESQNSFEALSKKSEILSKQYEEASRKVELYSERLEVLRNKRDEENAKIAENNAKLQEAQNKLSELKITMGETSEAYKTQAQTVENLKTQINDSGKALEYYDQLELKLETSLNNTTAEQIRYERELNETNSYLKEAESNTDKVATSINEYGQKVDKAGENTEKLTERLDSLAHNEALQRLGEDAKKVLESIMECAEVAENFEYAIAKVQSIARVSGDTLESMSSDIRRVGVEMGYSANEIAEATYQAISASVDASEAIGFVEDATKLARAGFTEVTTAVDVLTTALNAYGLESEATAHIADDLITTQNLGKTTVDQLAESIGTIIPTAAAYSVSLDQISAAYSILTRNGVNTAYATTYLRGMFNELADSGSDVADVLYNLTGHSFGELMKMGWSLGDVMQVLGDSVEGNSEAFANLFGNIRAGQGALNIFNAGADEFNRVLGFMENNAGAVDEAFATMADTAVMTNEKYEASIENLKIAIGESLSPAIQNLKEEAIDVLEPVTEFIEENPALIGAIAGIATGLAAATVAVTATAAAVTLLNAAFGGIPAILGMIIGGAAIGGGLLGLKAASQDATEEILKMSDSLKESHDVAVQAAEGNAKVTERARELMARYKELATQTGITDEALKEQNVIATELNSTISGLNIPYRESKYAIDDTTESIIANIEAMIAEQEAASKQEELVELYKEQAEAKKQLEEISEELAEAEEKELTYAEQLANGVTEAAGAYDTWHEKVLNLTEAQKDIQGIYDESTTKIDELTGEVVEYTEKTNEAIESVRAQEEAEKAKADAIDEASEKAKDAIQGQIDLLDEWEAKSDITFAKMQEAWESQTEGLNKYKENLEWARDIMAGDFTPEVQNAVANIVQLDDAGILANFREGFEELEGDSEKLEEFSEKWREYQEAIAGSEEVYEQILLAEQGYYTDSEDSHTEYIDNKNLATETQYQKEIDDANTQKDNLVQVTTDTVTEMSEAVTTTTETALKPAIDKMCTTVDTEARTKLLGGDNPQAGIGYKLGKELMEAIAKGITENEGVVASALNTAMQNAVNALDVSGLAAKVNAALGAALGG